MIGVFEFVCVAFLVGASMELDENTIFTAFFNSGLHGAVWPKQVYSVIGFKSRINLQQQTYTHTVKNDTHCHSEENAITFLRQKLQQHSLPSQTIRWFINYSPCRNCSNEINRFIRDARTVFGVVIKIDMTFPFLYKIRRPSCEEMRHSHVHKVTQSDHQKNLEGLEQLERNGVSVRTFGEADWKDLSRLLSLVHDPFLYPGSSRQTEDVLLKKDFRRLSILSLIKGYYLLTCTD